MSAALDAGDTDAARTAAEQLVSDVDTAIAAGAVPAALRAQLVAGIAQLLALLPEAQPPPAEDKKPGKGKGHGKKDEDDDE